MDRKVKPSPRLGPLPADTHPELAQAFEATRKRMGFLPNSMLIMQRRPKIVQAFTALTQAIRGPDCEVEPGLMALIAHVCSRAAGCQYCMAHTAHGASHRVEDAKLEAVWEYRTSPLFTEKERVALDYALAAGAVPNDVSDELFAEMRRHWSDDQIVDITALIAMFGFLNRWNDSMATPLEEEPMAVGGKYLAPHGWNAGKHGR